MKNNIAIRFIISAILGLTSCVSPFWDPPIKQEGTIWETDNPSMFFIVDTSINMATTGQIKGAFEIKIEFSYSDKALVYDTERFIYSESGGINTNEALLLKGDCKYSKKKFTMIVTESKLDSIKVGDVLVFERVEELPEWATDSADSTKISELISTAGEMPVVDADALISE